MDEPNPWTQSVRKKNRLGVFLVNQKGLASPYAKAFKDSVTAFNAFENRTCVRLDIVDTEDDANVKAYRLAFGEKVPVSWPAGDNRVLDGTKRADASIVWMMEYEGKAKRREIFGAAVGILVTKPGGKEDPEITKLTLVHEFIHAAGLNSNSLHDPERKDVFSADTTAWQAGAPDPLLGDTTISRLKRVWCAATAQKITLSLESRAHQA